MTFIVDVMLGTLAKWLRILGYDTCYNSHATDDELFFTAHLEKRILLTRDKELAGRMNPAYSYYVRPTHVHEQLKDVVGHFQLDWEHGIFTRCVRCNALVEPVEKKEIEHRLPPYVRQQDVSFVICRHCDKVYWPGSHIHHVRLLLDKIRCSGHVQD